MERHPEAALPIIDTRRCTGCGFCEWLCPTQSVAVRNGRAVIVRPATCTFCDLCESYCPAGAIGRPFAISFATSARHCAEPHSEENQ